MEFKVKEEYRGKTVLMTGCTGFLGKKNKNNKGNREGGVRKDDEE
jgi:hypothetical protein